MTGNGPTLKRSTRRSLSGAARSRSRLDPTRVRGYSRRWRHPLSGPAARQTSKKAAEQPFQYPLDRAYVEPDWTRLPGYRRVSRADWEDATWQRKNTVKNLGELKEALGELFTDALAQDMERDIRERATMSILITQHMINTMDEENLQEDPLRRYMLPAFSDR